EFDLSDGFGAVLFLYLLRMKSFTNGSGNVRKWKNLNLSS
ncbi:1048_t:CDS:1, partial [Dentiscutata erythropus]